MQNYTNNVVYVNTALDASRIISRDVPAYQRIQIDPAHPSYYDAKLIFDQSRYKYPYLPLYMGSHEISGHQNINLNVLRLMIRTNDQQAKVHLPEDLLPIKDMILDSINYHRQFYPANRDCFVYLTVRASTYDELRRSPTTDWHIDGFQGSRITRHLIEQDIFWTNVLPTEFSVQPFFCEGLDPSRHDISDFFNRNIDERYCVKTKSNSLYLVTPYNVHRRVPALPFEGKRIFVRINFSPVLIDDKSNTINPVFAFIKLNARVDVRNFLWSYNADERVDSGFEGIGLTPHG